MQKRTLTVVSVTVIVAAVAIAAIVFGPGNLGNLGAPEGGNTPQATTIGVPTWHAGDTWTYTINESAHDDFEDRPHAVGTLTRTVVSADASQYNVSVEGTFGVAMPAAFLDASPATAAMASFVAPFLQAASVEGYSWYRTSDLATLKDVRTVRIAGSAVTEHGTFNASYITHVETTYEPALDVWAFPIEENETWNATGNATIHLQVRGHFDGPDVFLEFTRNATFTAPVRLTLSSGESLDLVTPAGTFRAIPVHVGMRDDDRAYDPDESMMGLGHDDGIGHPGPVTIWFSDAAKGPVQVSIFLRGIRVEAVLTSYDLA